MKTLMILVKLLKFKTQSLYYRIKIYFSERRCRHLEAERDRLLKRRKSFGFPDFKSENATNQKQP